jgi:hypothetical protein
MFSLLAFMAENDKSTQIKEELLKSIGNRMAELRKKEGYKNYENFTTDKGLNRTQYGKYESGAKDMQISSLIKVIFKYDDMNVQKFFDGVEIPEEFIKSINKSEEPK